VTYIYKNFTAISLEKQMRIMNAAYEEFARHGYKKASTNKIIEDAKIGKGMLFHYFGSKEGLYNYLLEYAAAFFKEYFGNIDEKISDVDFIEKYRILSKIKLEAYLKNPYIFEFITKIYFDPKEQDLSDKARTVYDEICAMRTEALAVLSSDKGTADFRTDLDVLKSKNYITWCFEGYSQQLLARINGIDLTEIDFTPYWAEFDEILDDLKKLFYK